MNIPQYVKQLFDQTSFLDSPVELYEPIQYTMHLGGKRLRPLLLLTAADMFGNDPTAAAPAAVAIETFHNFTLVHDDLMDHAALRRGQPAVHSKWNANTAILSGDTMFAIAWRHLLRLRADNLNDIMTAFSDTAVGVCEGQQLDMNFESRHDVTIEEYMEMIRLKTAVLLAGALKIGALCAHAPDDDTERLYQFGIHLGLAFQLQDDLLDAYGDTATFGKQTGQDIVDNKKTFLLLKALELASPSQTEELHRWFSDESRLSRDEKISGVIALYDRLDIRHHTQLQIERQFAAATDALRTIVLPDSKKEPLQQLAQCLLYRQS
ncbi:MAG: Geranylgeranyl pyrophosphate synthase [bacterium P3]|nr:MAG: Geranylgeranyl pyrophosphate synthase [bacterium P3]KWW41840.1 MAG: Geranylgeranyl pyrophosphate synthase [bacterium F083]